MITPVVSVAQFRQDYPEFGSLEAYPDSAVTYYLTWATILMNPDRWMEVLPLAVELYAAHFLTEERAAFLNSITGLPAGNVPGPVTAKSVDKVSLSYDISSVSDGEAGDWNQTIYGRRLWRLIQMAGMGPIQVGVGCTPPWVWNGTAAGAGGAWPGPPCWPGWFGS
jgi:hypothetical protein